MFCHCNWIEKKQSLAGEFSVPSSLILVEDLKVLDHICSLDDDDHDKGIEDEHYIDDTVSRPASPRRPYPRLTSAHGGGSSSF